MRKGPDLFSMWFDDFALRNSINHCVAAINSSAVMFLLGSNSVKDTRDKVFLYNFKEFKRFPVPNFDGTFDFCSAMLLINKKMEHILYLKVSSCKFLNKAVDLKVRNLYLSQHFL